MISTIYKARNTINNKIYIGFDSNWPRRKHAHKKNFKYRNGKFYDAIKKYGWDAFEWEILYQSEDKEYCLNVSEKHFIKKFDSMNNGYNMTEGGDGCFGATKNKIWVNNGEITKRVNVIPPGWNLGRLKIKRKFGMSAESKKMIGLKNKLRGTTIKLNNTLLTCPHCNKTMNYGLSKRWHFDNCKIK